MSSTKLNKIKQLLGLESTEVETPEVEVKLEQIKLENGTVLEAEAFEPGYPVFVVSEDEQIPVPIGEYELEGGSVLVVEEEGIIGSIGEAAAPSEEEVPAEMEAEESKPKKVVESTVKESHFSSDEFLTTLSENEDVLTKLADMVFSKLEEKLSSYTIEAGEMETEELEQKLAKEVKVEAEEIKPSKHNPELKTESKRIINNKRPKTIMDRVFEKMQN